MRVYLVYVGPKGWLCIPGSDGVKVHICHDRSEASCCHPPGPKHSLLTVSWD
jgi:hypothetical protein